MQQIKKNCGPLNINAKVALDFIHGLPSSRLRRQVNHCMRIDKPFFQGIPVANICLDDFNLFFQIGRQCITGMNLGTEIIKQANLLSRCKKGANDPLAYKPGTTGYKDMFI